MDIEINGKKYDSMPYDGCSLSMYLYEEVLYDELPKGAEVRRIVKMDKDTVGVCYPVFPKLLIRAILIVALAIIVVATIALGMNLIDTLKNKHPQSDVEVVDDSTESAVVSMITDTDYILKYNRYTVLTDGYIDIMYQNIDKEVTLTISDVECKPITVAPNEYIPMLAVDVPDNTEFPLRATMVVTIDGDKYNVPIVINDKDSIEYQTLKRDNTSDNKVNLDELSNTEYEDPETYKDEERAIHD